MKCPNCGYTRWYSPDHRGPCNCSLEAMSKAAKAKCTCGPNVQAPHAHKCMSCFEAEVDELVRKTKGVMQR